MVGATNVGRIKIVGDGLDLPRRFRRGEKIARFEMGSTVVLVSSRGAAESHRRRSFLGERPARTARGRLARARGSAASVSLDDGERRLARASSSPPSSRLEEVVRLRRSCGPFRAESALARGAP